jgi:PAS domain S-box-containing protein
MPNEASTNSGFPAPHEQAVAHLAALIDSTEDFVWSVDLDFRLVTFNRALQRYCEARYGIQAAAGMRPEDLLPPDRAARWITLYEQTLKEGSCVSESARADGRPTELTLYPIVIDGRVTGISIFGKDISERKEAEESRALLASIVESSNDAIHTVKLDGTLVSWNRGCESLFGYTAEEVLGKSVSFLAPPGRGQEAPAFIGAVAQGDVIEPFDTSLRAKDGQEIHVSLSIAPIRNSEGKVIGASASARDIRERLRVERELKAAESRYRKIFDGALEGMFQNLTEGTPRVVNHALARMLGYDSPEEFLSRVENLAVEVWKDPADRLRFLQLLEAHGAVRAMECQFKRKDRSVIWVSLSCQKVAGADPQTQLIDGFIEDITERKQAEMELQKTAESLKESQAIGGLGSYELDFGTMMWTSSSVLDRIFGIDAEYVRDLSGWEALIHRDEREVIKGYLKETVIGQRKPFDREYRIIRHDDHEERWVNGMGKLEVDAQGRPVKMRGVIKDITEHKRAEMQIRESEERYRATFEQAAFGITHGSFEGRILRSNTRFAEFLGSGQCQVLC